MMKRYQSNVMLLLAAFIWGNAFVAQRIGMSYVGPWTFTCIRSWIAGIALLCVGPYLHKEKTSFPLHDVKLWQGGIACGVLLMAASMFQQYGIQDTSVGKAGFITALYVVIVPILSIFLNKRTTLQTWISVCLALLGLYFLSMQESLTIQRGDLLVLICAFLFALHILVIDHYVRFVDGIWMSCIQFFVVGLLCLIPMLVMERPTISQIIGGIGPILYAGVLSSGAGYTLQILGQKNADPTVATLLLSLESAFAALAGYVFLHQVLNPRELWGCILVFIAVILAQVRLRHFDA